MTLEEAVGNAARLLNAAEAETDRGLAELHIRCAETWVTMAGILAEQTV